MKTTQQSFQKGDKVITTPPDPFLHEKNNFSGMSGVITAFIGNQFLVHGIAWEWGELSFEWHPVEGEMVYASDNGTKWTKRTFLFEREGGTAICEHPDQPGILGYWEYVRPFKIEVSIEELIENYAKAHGFNELNIKVKP